jgi:hypothetical protein
VHNLSQKWVQIIFLEVKCGWPLRPTTSPPSISRWSRQCKVLNISHSYRPPRPVTYINLLFVCRWYPYLKEIHVWVSTACYGDSFTLWYVDVHTSQKTHLPTSTACYANSSIYSYILHFLRKFCLSVSRLKLPNQIGMLPISNDELMQYELSCPWHIWLYK